MVNNLLTFIDNLKTIALEACSRAIVFKLSTNDFFFHMDSLLSNVSILQILEYLEN